MQTTPPEAPPNFSNLARSFLDSEREIANALDVMAVPLSMDPSRLLPNVVSKINQCVDVEARLRAFAQAIDPGSLEGELVDGYAPIRIASRQRQRQIIEQNTYNILRACEEIRFQITAITSRWWRLERSHEPQIDPNALSPRDLMARMNDGYHELNSLKEELVAQQATLHQFMTTFDTVQSQSKEIVEEWELQFEDHYTHYLTALDNLVEKCLQVRYISEYNHDIARKWAEKFEVIETAAANAWFTASIAVIRNSAGVSIGQAWEILACWAASRASEMYISMQQRCRHAPSKASSRRERVIRSRLQIQDVSSSVQKLMETLYPA